jgi:hypothetical protein
MQFAEIIEHWTGWCPKKQKIMMASRTDFISRDTSMKTENPLKSRTIGIAAIALVFIAAFAGMKMEFDSMQSLDWLMSNDKAVEGYQWLANNTEEDATILAWWDYADGIKKIGHRDPVINEASRKIQNTIAGYADSKKSWRKIEYALWYPYESDEKVKDVADFLISENSTSAKEIARRHKANWALVMSDDLGKYWTLVMAADRNFSDYMGMPDNLSSRISDLRPYLKKQTIFTRMVNGDNIDGFSKAFDNGQMRIYRLS